MKRGIGVCGFGLCALFLAGCDSETREPELLDTVRAIKTFTVTEAASGQVRKFSGIVQATDSSTLSFQVPGNVREIRVQVGDHIAKDQVLAVLDEQPYRLDIQAVEADLGKARAELEHARTEFTRQEQLFAKGWVAQANLDQAKRSHESAANAVDYANAKLDLARRNLAHATLTAPFTGVVSDRFVDPFVEIAAGEQIFKVDAEGAFEVAFDVPETIISRVVVGIPATVVFSGSQLAPARARVSEVGSVAGVANAFPVKAGLFDPPEALRSGMSAEVSILLHDERLSDGYLVPLVAIAPGSQPRQGFVFVYDAETSKVRKTPIRAQGIKENMVAVTGVEPGDVIAFAGVHFLADGQQVKLMTP